MVEQGKVVAGVSFPSVGRADRRARASGVALVHRDYAEILGQLSGRVEGAAAPEIDAGAHPARREQQQRVTRPIFLVVQRYARALKNRHQSTSAADTASEYDGQSPMCHVSVNPRDTTVNSQISSQDGLILL